MKISFKVFSVVLKIEIGVGSYKSEQLVNFSVLIKLVQNVIVILNAILKEKMQPFIYFCCR